MKAGKGDALRQEKGLFYILFVAAWTKRMASGGTRPAGSALSLKKKKEARDKQPVASSPTSIVDTNLNFVRDNHNR
jgi:hypothetical protein